MKQELQQKIVEACPNVTFEDHWFGFECGDGWFELLFKLFQKLNVLGGVSIGQVKEKFAEIVVHGNGPDEMKAFIAEAKAESRQICEQCGKPGTRGRPESPDPEFATWIRVSCTDHAGMGWRDWYRSHVGYEKTHKTV